MDNTFLWLLQNPIVGAPTFKRSASKTKTSGVNDMMPSAHIRCYDPEELCYSYDALRAIGKEI